MSLKNIKIGYKIIGSFLLATLLLCIIGFTGLNGIARTQDTNNDAVYYIQVSKEMLKREIAHLYWTQKALEEINNLSVTKLSVGSDDHGCTTGEMLYGPERKIIEAKLPNLSALFKKIEGPHNKFHESANGIEDLLGSTIESRQVALEYFSQESAVYMAELVKIFKEIGKEVDRMAQAKSKMATDVKSDVFFRVILIIIVGSILVIILGVFISKSITKPMQKGVVLAQAIESGDLTKELNMDREDEIGDLANALDSMTRNLRKMINEMKNNASILSSSATEFSAISEQMLGSSASMDEKTTTVASATEEINVNMSTISSTSSQSAESISIIASSTEEMTATVSEIAENTAKARQIASNAVKTMSTTLEKVGTLDTTADDIGKVVDVILEIAEQTKLLALNATIEAARAGDAGKGFAVVANEVKELAKQTNEAVEDIQIKVVAIQDSTGTTIEQIKGIDSVITEVNEIVGSIATAVEEQSVTTKDISGNITNAADGIKEMTHNVSEAASVTSDISKDVYSLSQNSSDVKSGSIQVNEGVVELSRMGESLTKLVKTFKLN